jgi:hypothetical protein
MKCQDYSLKYIGQTGKTFHDKYKNMYGQLGLIMVTQATLIIY